MSSSAPASDWDDDTRFRITAPGEILGELRAAQAQRSLLTIQYGDARACTLTTVLEVNSAARTLILDACQDPDEHRKVLAAHQLTLETEVRRIRIRFDSGRAAPLTHEGRPALQIALPASMLRIQRREAYRIDTPVNEAVNCRFAHPARASQEVVLRVADLSVKGMGITADPGLLPAAQGEVLKDCRIELPDTGVVHCDALIVRVFEAPRPSNQRLWIGCQFLRLPGSAGTLLQRYILKLERERLARSRGG
jgi:c-di-GMP-binding flagellar brake protein YcgR